MNFGLGAITQGSKSVNNFVLGVQGAFEVAKPSLAAPSWESWDVLSTWMAFNIGQQRG